MLPQDPNLVIRLASTAVLGAVSLLLGCQPSDTSRLSPTHESRLASERIRFRAANLVFRYSHDAGTREAGWEDRVASIVVTDSSVLIHKKDKVGIEITSTSRRYYAVSRERDRVRINAGAGRSRETWSFVPPDSAAAWTEAIRAVIRASKSEANQ